MTLTTIRHADTRLWTLRAPHRALGQPVLSGATVYVSVAESGIVALDAYSGEIRWHNSTLSRPDSAGVVAGAGFVVVPVSRERERSGFAVLDAKTGGVLWSRRKGVLHRVAVAGSTVVLWNDPDDDRSRMAGVDALTGETLWEDEFERIFGLLVRGDKVILDAGGIRALDARTGDEIWSEGYGHLLGQDETGDADFFHLWQSSTLSRRATDTGKTLTRTDFPSRALKPFRDSSPVLTDGGRALFSQILGRRIRVFSYTEGEKAVSVWRPRRAWWRFSSLGDSAVLGDRVYHLAHRNRLYTAETGKHRGLRRLRLTTPDGRGLRHPEHLTAGPAQLFVTGSSAIAAVSDGRMRWVRETDEWDQTPVPFGADRVLFRSTSDTHHRLHCADAASGTYLP